MSCIGHQMYVSESSLLDTTALTQILMDPSIHLTHNTNDTQTPSLSYPSSPLLPSHRFFFSLSWWSLQQQRQLLLLRFHSVITMTFFSCFCFFFLFFNWGALHASPPPPNWFQELNPTQKRTTLFLKTHFVFWRKALFWCHFA